MRLTRKTEAGHIRLRDCTVSMRDIMDKLAEYEDTGLMPEQIEAMKGFANTVGNELAEYKDLEEQGLLLRLPCKVCDTVYWVTQLGVLERYVSSMDLIRTNHIAVKLQPLGLDGELYPFSTIAFSEDFGKTVFLAKEEAEQALAEREEGKQVQNEYNS